MAQTLHPYQMAKAIFDLSRDEMMYPWVREEGGVRGAVAEEKNIPLADILHKIPGIKANKELNPRLGLGVAILNEAMTELGEPYEGITFQVEGQRLRIRAEGDLGEVETMKTGYQNGVSFTGERRFEAAMAEAFGRPPKAAAPQRLSVGDMIEDIRCEHAKGWHEEAGMQMRAFPNGPFLKAARDFIAALPGITLSERRPEAEGGAVRPSFRAVLSVPDALMDRVLVRGMGLEKGRILAPEAGAEPIGETTTGVTLYMVGGGKKADKNDPKGGPGGSGGPGSFFKKEFFGGGLGAAESQVRGTPEKEPNR
jgi:hypothetical protein